MIGRPGRTLEHIYNLVNNTGRTVRILDVVNRKPCCGSVNLSRSVLADRQEASVKVVLSLSGQFGQLVHETLLVTDSPGTEELMLRTLAEVYPPVRIEERSQAGALTLLSLSKPRRCEFTAYAYGLVSDFLLTWMAWFCVQM